MTALGGSRRLEALGDQAAVGPPGLDRALPARGGGEAGAGLAIRGSEGRAAAVRRPLIAAAVRSASSALRSCSRTSSAPPATASAVAAAVAHSRSAAGARLSQEPASTAPRKSFRDRAMNSGRPSVAQLAQAPQDFQVVVDREVEVEAGIQRDLLLGDAVLERRLDALREPALQVGDGIPVAGRLAIGAGRTLDVHEHVAAAPSATRSSIPGLAPPEVSLIAAAPASSARLAGSG